MYAKTLINLWKNSIHYVLGIFHHMDVTIPKPDKQKVDLGYNTEKRI